MRLFEEEDWLMSLDSESNSQGLDEIEGDEIDGYLVGVSDLVWNVLKEHAGVDVGSDNNLHDYSGGDVGRNHP